MTSVTHVHAYGNQTHCTHLTGNIRYLYFVIIFNINVYSYLAPYQKVHVHGEFMLYEFRRIGSKTDCKSTDHIVFIDTKII